MNVSNQSDNQKHNASMQQSTPHNDWDNIPNDYKLEDEANNLKEQFTKLCKEIKKHKIGWSCLDDWLADELRKCTYLHEQQVEAVTTIIRDDQDPLRPAKVIVDVIKELTKNRTTTYNFSLFHLIRSEFNEYIKHERDWILRK